MMEAQPPNDDEEADTSDGDFSFSPFSLLRQLGEHASSIQMQVAANPASAEDIETGLESTNPINNGE